MYGYVPGREDTCLTIPFYFYPKPGTVMICDFGTGFRPPEMVKKRPVVVISPRSRRGSPLCTVVPLSTAVPDPVQEFHHCLDPESLPGDLATKETWAKCDMVATVSLKRLDRVRIGQDAAGKRIYVAMQVTEEDFAAIRRCVTIALGLSD